MSEVTEAKAETAKVEYGSIVTIVQQEGDAKLHTRCLVVDGPDRLGTFRALPIHPDGSLGEGSRFLGRETEFVSVEPPID